MRGTESKAFAVALLILLMLLSVGGCGKKGAPQPTGEADGYIYIPAARGDTPALTIWPQVYQPAERGVVEVMPVEGARVSIAGTSTEVLTNAAGYFKISGLKAGQYTLVVRYGELAPAILIFSVVGGHVTHCDNRPPPETASAASTPSIAATAAFRELVLSQEKQPESGTAIAELASGTNLENERTIVTLPDDAVAVASAYETEVRDLLEKWNRAVLAAREELALEQPADRATAVLRDSSGRTIIRVETTAQN